MKKDITLTQQDQQRLRVVEQIQAGRWTASEGATALGLSARQMYRLKAKHEKEGAAALVHGNRGRTPQNRISEEERAQIVRLATETYVKYSASHLHDVLMQREGIVLSSKSIGRVLREAGIRSSRKRRLPRHRVRRDRMEQEGMLIQVDGSDHHWFGKERPRATLLGAIDDATGKVIAAVFREHEDAQGYLLVFQQILKHRGVPLELYHDRHGIFEQNRPKWSVAEELRGELDPTQVTRALKELGITSIAAHSPQAKGRVERLWGTWQDRLVKELSLDGITDIEAGNAYLPGYNERHNARFAVTPADPGLAYRRLDPSLDLDRILSFRSGRVVANDNTVQFQGQRLQIPAEPWRRSYARARVDVHQLLDGGLGIWYQGNWLLRTSPSPQPPVLRAPRRSSKRAATSPILVAPAAPEQVSLPQPTRRPDRPRVRADHGRCSAPCRHLGTGVGVRDADAAALHRLRRVDRRRAVVRAAANDHCADAADPRLLDREPHGADAGHAAETVVGVDKGKRRTLLDDLERRRRVDRAGRDPLPVGAKPPHALALAGVEPQLAVEQGLAVSPACSGVSPIARNARTAKSRSASASTVASSIGLDSAAPQGRADVA